VSAFIGVVYIVILELVQLILQYNDGLTHSVVALFFYIVGIFANYAMQKKVVFNASNAPWLSFLIYNVFSALLVSGLSGYLYSSELLRSIFMQYIEGASTAIALLINSPVTFIVFKKIFKNSAQTHAN